jgi:hypothetical protein
VPKKVCVGTQCLEKCVFRTNSVPRNFCVRTLALENEYWSSVTRKVCVGTLCLEKRVLERCPQKSVKACVGTCELQ